MFAEFGISRPSGWLSDGEEEDFSRHHDGSNSIPRYTTNICHSCGAQVTSRRFCNTCGHAVCPQCASEILDDEDDLRRTESIGYTVATREQGAVQATDASSRRGTSESSRTTQKAEVPSLALKNNPFIVADKMTKIATVEPQVTNASVRGEQQARLSDCVPKQTDLSKPGGSHGDCGNPRCNATHAGHHSGRHSIACIIDQDAVTDAESNDVRSHPPLEDPLQGKIDKMYHHAEDLRRTQHIMEHLAAGSVATDGRNLDNAAELTGVSASASHAPNLERLISYDTAIASSTKNSRDLHLHEWERSQSVNVDPIKKNPDSPPSSPETRLSSPPEWLSPKQTLGSPKGRLEVMDTQSAPHVEQLNGQKNTESNEYLIEWPKLKKVTKETVVETEKASLPWMQRHLRRVQKEENISEQAQTQKSAEVESWRSQLRKVTAIDTGSAEASYSKESHHKDRKRAETCNSCPPDTVSSSFADEVTDTQSEKRSVEYPNLAWSKQLEEVRVSTSRNSSSKTTTRVESETIAHVSRKLKQVRSKSSASVVEENDAVNASQAIEDMFPNSDEVEVFRPVPIMPSTHDCAWKERYLDLTAEVRQLKADIASRERIGSMGFADRDTNVNQDDDDLGIEGLTIVMHLKGKDDLVINTDLTRASPDV